MDEKFELMVTFFENQLIFDIKQADWLEIAEKKDLKSQISRMFKENYESDILKFIQINLLLG